mgnify:CR=1 FL=1
MSTIEWLNNQKPKIMLLIVPITWQNYSKKSSKMRRQFNTSKLILKQQSLKNKIKKIENLLTRQELHLRLPRQTETWTSTFKCLLMMIRKA